MESKDRRKKLFARNRIPLEQVITLLDDIKASGISHQDACKKYGISRATYYRSIRDSHLYGVSLPQSTMARKQQRVGDIDENGIVHIGGNVTEENQAAETITQEHLIQGDM